ncbi:MAG: PA5502 family lipoprotein [Pseudomonas sp.]|uniref:PA5502 family lipoprotein n=1 Tax=Pseudomonas sp. TaxID=306 RepID=UPI0030F120F6
MKLFASRYLPVLAISLLLAACHQAAPKVANLPTDDLIAAFRQVEQSLNAGQLTAAEEQLNTIAPRAQGDTRLEQYQRQLADAYLQQGQNALQQGDLDTATKALSHARSLMPQAPALTKGLDASIAQARAAELNAAEQQRARAAQAAAKDAADRAELLRQQRIAAEKAKAATPSEAPVVQAPVVTEAAKPNARIINPAAASSVVSLPMLDNQDNERLRSLLDAVAADVVTFNCDVRIEVRQAKDYPWVASLLLARIKRLDPSFSPRLSQALKLEQVPRLLLTPQAKG